RAVYLCFFFSFFFSSYGSPRDLHSFPHDALPICPSALAPPKGARMAMHQPGQFAIRSRLRESQSGVLRRRSRSIGLLGRLLQRRDTRQDDLDARPRPGLGLEIEPSAETIGDDVVDDVQAEAGAALIAPRREERIEGAAPDVQAHAAAIVGEDDLDIVASGLAGLDLDRA